ncbi:hypothetical protein [Streptomyces sp. CB01881]|uniref:hypothetical protein n=1 Tax=Streptomyces sp. CB01881 TaxID=2078691 RepID=UPI0011DFD58B|nr:hypothetical protein [Streptomyces sp. CB01881]TYC71346.1 hypothetical protein EH183_26715 [Streptomyces sp. CB01881]
MSTTTDILTAAGLLGPGIALAVPVLISQRGAKTDSAAVKQVLAESAAERAARAVTDSAAPPDGGEGAPTLTDRQPARLATVLPFPGAGRQAA